MKYLFQVSIGPVQSFIASARRTQDLRFSSQLLSELAKTAAKKIVEENTENMLIFPAPLSKKELIPGSELNVANKIVALVYEPQQLGDKVHEAIHERLESVKESAAWERIDEQYKNDANAQIDDLIEYFWVALPFIEDKYEEIRKRLEALMAARKNTRDFSKVTWGSGQPKSSIDGQLESVIPEDKYPYRKDSPEDRLSKVSKLYENYGAGPAERLSGVDLLKRKGQIGSDTHFPSTSHMATLSFLKRLEQLTPDKLAKSKEQWSIYIKELQKIAIAPKELERIPHRFPTHVILDRYEGSLLFEERLVDMVDESNAGNSMRKDLGKVKRALRDFYSTIDNIHPIPYYAIIQADGDHMGAVIDHRAKEGYKAHQELSQQLDNFSRGVLDIVKKYEGALVYAGGDDVQALLPLHTVLQCAQALAEHFRKTLENFDDGKGGKPTLSVGIAIVHHLDSLQDSLGLARSAEAKAKKLDAQKNALAIIVSKRGGSDYSIVGRWEKIDIRLNSLIKFYELKSIPAGTAYELQSLVQRLGVLTDTSITLHKAARAEASRILERKLALISEERKQEVMNVIGTKLDEHQASVGKKLEQLVNEMLVAQLLAEANILATMK